MRVQTLLLINKKFLRQIIIPSPPRIHHWRYKHQDQL